MRILIIFVALLMLVVLLQATLGGVGPLGAQRARGPATDSLCLGTAFRIGRLFGRDREGE